jgi:hypothetical protein
MPTLVGLAAVAEPEPEKSDSSEPEKIGATASSSR